MTKQFVAALIATLLVVTAEANGDQLYPNTGASTPATGVTGAFVEQGKKGILFTMQCLDVNNIPTTNCWPIVNGTPSLSINGGAPITCANTLNPAPNGCGYTIGAFTPADLNVDTFKIFYNGIFPNNASIAVSVSGATGNAGSTEPNCPNPGDAGCTLSFTVGANAPRTGASTELVFDISGSMSQPAVPGGMPPATCPANPTPAQPVQRICALKLAADRFLAAYEPMTMLGDKLGVIFFSTAASSPGGAPNFVNAIDPSQVNTVKSQVDAQGPTNSTAIGQGLQLANTDGFAADAGSNNAKWVFLFTDGEQNVAPNVDPPMGTQLTIGGSTYSTSTGGQPNPGQIWVCPITAGRQTAVGFSLLQGIANVLCKSQNAYIGGTDQNFFQAALDSYFAQLLTMTLQGDKFEISRDIVSTVKATPSVTFFGNGDDHSFEIILANHAERGDYRLVAPDGTVVPLRQRFFPGGSVAKLDLPVVVGKKRLPVQGPWKIVFDARTFGNAPDYHLIVINDNAAISTTFTTLGGDVGTGDPLQVQATILEKGKPIPNATVTVDITGPAAGLGNVLSTTKTSGEPPNLRGDNPGGAGARKLLALYNDPRNAKLFATNSRPAIKLRYCRPGAASEQDRECQKTTKIDPAGPRGGVYTGTYTNSALEGHYFFTFHASGTSAATGPFQRTWQVALFVRPKPFGPNTPVVVQTIAPSPNGGIAATLRVTPHDRIGNFIGPGYDGALEFVNGIAPFPFAADNLDGSYEFRVSTAPGNSKLVLRALGLEVKTIDLATARPGQTL